jgi:ABC-type multidrug transport system fused ATPase/permease subunit
MSSNPLYDIPRYVRIFQQQVGIRIYLVFALTLFAAFAEGFGILMVIPLLQALDGSYSGSVKLPQGQITSTPFSQAILGKLGEIDSIPLILAIIGMAFLIKGALIFLTMSFRAYLRGKLLLELKSRIFSGYRRMNYAYYSQRNAAHFLSIINDQVDKNLWAFFSFISVSSQVVNALIYIALAFLVAWRFGLMALILGITLLLLFKWINIRVREISRVTAAEESRIANLCIQILHAYKYLTTTNQLSSVGKSLTQSFHNLSHYHIKRDTLSSVVLSIREPIAIAAIILIMYFQLVVFKQPLAPILISILLFYRGLNMIFDIQGGWQHTLENIGSVEAISGELARLSKNQELDGKLEVTKLTKEIELSSVWFSYDTRGPTLKDVSLKISANTSVALIGVSGAGKSTVVDILTCIHKPTKGRVFIDGIAAEKINLSSWRSQIGYVSQDLAIFDDSIANNICMWSGNPTLDLELLARIKAAASEAELLDFIEGLPDGFCTMVGDRGIRLSGGQRQRLFIARELFRRPNLLILDEATSALDVESELRIQKSIDALKGMMTIVVIAHRLSTIKNVDYVICFEGGEVIEQGPYFKLASDKNSRLAGLIAAQ